MDTTTNTTCVECDAEQAVSYSRKCERCFDRSDNDQATHELALIEDDLRRWNTSDGERWHRHAYAVERRAEAELPIINGGDPRIAGLWHTLWEALAGDVERDATWGLFMEAIPGLPDHRVRTYSGTVVLRFDFSTIEISGDLSDWEIESAILDQISSDLHYNDADGIDVEYDED
jgi:precorrin-3B methylase